MTSILHKYWIILIVLSFLTIAALSYFLMSKQNTTKAPSKGVFVMQTNFSSGEGMLCKRHLPKKNINNM
jgi:hypothetical protein